MLFLAGLRTCRERRHYTEIQLSRLTRFAAHDIRAVERGERRVRRTTAARFAIALDVELIDLVANYGSHPVLRYIGMEQTLHAAIRLQERGIHPSRIGEVLAAPDCTYPSEGAMVAEKVCADGKPWRVVFTKVATDAGLLANIVTIHRIDRVSGSGQL